MDKTWAYPNCAFLVRSSGLSRAGKLSSTMMAEARVVLARGAYFGLETKVIWPEAAASIVAIPVMSTSTSRGSIRAPILLASSLSFMRNCTTFLSQQRCFTAKAAKCAKETKNQNLNHRGHKGTQRKLKSKITTEACRESRGAQSKIPKC